MHRGSWLALSTLLVALLASDRQGLAAGPARAGSGAMTVTQLEGEAKATAKGGGPALPLVLAEVLNEGDVVETGPGARVELSLASGTVIRFGESTRAELREAPPEGGRFRLKLAIGNFWARVAKLAADQHFEVETENGVAGVRGTEFEVEAAPEGGEDLLRVHEGRVQCESLPGRASWRHFVEPGHELRFQRERKPKGPVASGAPASSLREWKRAQPGEKREAPKQDEPKKDQPKGEQPEPEKQEKPGKSEKKGVKERLRRLFR